MSMNFDIQAGEFVQILHTGQGHRNTVSTNHPEVQVVCSLLYLQWVKLKSQLSS